MTLNAIIANFQTFKIVDLLDIIIIAFLIYQLLGIINRTRAGQLAKGALLVMVVYLVANTLNMRTVTWLLNSLLQVGLLTLVVLFTTGIVGSSVAMAKDWADTARILLFPGTGWPQQTGVMEVKQLASMNSSFVELGEEGCVVWSRTGTRLNSIQSGYARPALAVGKNRFVLYNRSGNELRVESRTQNLYTKTMENSITLCAMADNGTLAVVTEDPGSAARLRVYSSSMEQLLSWSLTIADGTPLRLAFSPDGRRLAVAAVTVNGGQMVTNFYVVTLAQGDPMLVGSGSGAAQWLSWTGSQSILAVCDSRAVLYNASGGERAAYDFTGQTLRDISVDASGNTALLLASGQLCQAVMLSRDLGVENTTQVQASNRPGRRHLLSAHRYRGGVPFHRRHLPVDPEPFGPPAGSAGRPQAAAGLLRQYGAGIDPACGGKQRSKQYIIRKTRYVQESVISF